MVDLFGVVPAKRTEALAKEEEEELRKLGLLGRRKRYRGHHAEGFNEDMINAIFKVRLRCYCTCSTWVPGFTYTWACICFFL